MGSAEVEVTATNTVKTRNEEHYISLPPASRMAGSAVFFKAQYYVVLGHLPHLMEADKFFCFKLSCKYD